MNPSQQKLTLFLLVLLTRVAYSQDPVLSVEWTDLLSQSDLEAILNPPEMSHDLYGWQEQLDNNPEATAYNDALQSYNVNPDLVNKRIMIPGFIVPTAYNEERKITEFFWCPFSGPAFISLRHRQIKSSMLAMSAVLRLVIFTTPTSCMAY